MKSLLPWKTNNLEAENERMKEWKNERMKEWKNERMKEWKNERMKEWKNFVIKNHFSHNWCLMSWFFVEKEINFGDTSKIEVALSKNWKN